jgi:hypothetical protein
MIKDVIILNMFEELLSLVAASSRAYRPAYLTNSALE